MPAIRHLAHRIAALCLLLAFLASGQFAPAQNIPGHGNNIEAALLAEGPAQPGEEIVLALHFTPISGEWHGYWQNPGDAGYGMTLEWDLPDGWKAGEPQYPVPQRLLIGDLMNHIYEGPYAVLVPVKVPESAASGTLTNIALDAQWLACTDKICVPEQGRLELAIPIGGDAAADERVMRWRAAVPPELDSTGLFEIAGETLRISLPIPADFAVDDPHIFIAERDLGDGLAPAYAAEQEYSREGDRLIAEVSLNLLELPEGSEIEFAPRPETISGILALGDGSGLQFSAQAGAVPAIETISLISLLLAAIAGGLILNIMPCVFPILSLKALSLARSGASEDTARKEGVAYSIGVILACVALGGIMLALRAAGQQVGWAFQLQEPAVVVALLVLALAITANLAGVFELPAVSITRKGEPASAFATGLLAAVAATPCTSPFMAAALGAALLLPTVQALTLFAALGFGLALPFLLIGFFPPLRRILPKPGAWMERFRKLMAIPMGLTALALIWLVSRLGGQGFALVTMVLLIGLFIALAVVGRLQKAGKMAWPAFGLIAAPFLIFAAFALPASYSTAAVRSAPSILNPIDFSADALSNARKSGRPVFVWMTADWCVSCKLNESVAIEREATRAAFEKAGVIAIRGDWTIRENPVISSYLTQQGVAGIPLYVWYAPGKEGEHLPQILTPDSLVTLAQQYQLETAGTPQSAPPDAGSHSE
ncbi:protein-disulfide reductase DsbD family protein [Pontixanthobacter aquaemixtae]|uniref:Thiol:disulfide interchange protein n=1 Tax=Pontixanthobacter aquaemixtae TaxID=1958940 RepID=A0A844ZUL3_9SPHN|nr:protein-disulfide reductase DsbD domain-containing protein [Pontixanthobacter aquaemixtae]MXO90810.1 thiol:disulfide interchange protein [Pontixanthobacter aquaemixtae]